MAMFNVEEALENPEDIKSFGQLREEKRDLRLKNQELEKKVLKLNDEISNIREALSLSESSDKSILSALGEKLTELEKLQEQKKSLDKELVGFNKEIEKLNQKIEKEEREHQKTGYGEKLALLEIENLNELLEDTRASLESALSFGAEERDARKKAEEETIEAKKARNVAEQGERIAVINAEDVNEKAEMEEARAETAESIAYEEHQARRSAEIENAETIKANKKLGKLLNSETKKREGAERTVKTQQTTINALGELHKKALSEKETFKSQAKQLESEREELKSDNANLTENLRVVSAERDKSQKIAEGLNITRSRAEAKLKRQQAISDIEKEQLKRNAVELLKNTKEELNRTTEERESIKEEAKALAGSLDTVTKEKEKSDKSRQEAEQREIETQRLFSDSFYKGFLREVIYNEYNVEEESFAEKNKTQKYVAAKLEKARREAIKKDKKAEEKLNKALESARKNGNVATISFDKPMDGEDAITSRIIEKYIAEKERLLSEAKNDSEKDIIERNIGHFEEKWGASNPVFTEEEKAETIVQNIISSEISNVKSKQAWKMSLGSAALVILVAGSIVAASFGIGRSKDNQLSAIKEPISGAMTTISEKYTSINDYNAKADAISQKEVKKVAFAVSDEISATNDHDIIDNAVLKADEILANTEAEKTKLDEAIKSKDIDAAKASAGIIENYAEEMTNLEADAKGAHDRIVDNSNKENDIDSQLSLLNPSVSSSMTKIDQIFVSINSTKSNADNINKDNTIEFDLNDSVNYQAIKNSFEEGESIWKNAQIAFNEFNVAFNNKDITAASEAEIKLRDYASLIEEKNTKLQKDYELLRQEYEWAVADRLNKDEEAHDMVNKPTVSVDVTAKIKLSKLFEGAVKKATATYTKASGRVSILVEIEQDDGRSIQGTVEFDAEKEIKLMDYETIIQQMNKAAKFSVETYDRTLNARVMYTIDRKYSVKTDITNFSATAIVLDEGENAGYQTVSCTLEGKNGNVALSAVEQEIKEQIINQIEAELGITVDVDGDYGAEM